MPEAPRIVCVVPTIRPERHAEFVKAWAPLFEKHKVTLVTVWDGDEPRLQADGPLAFDDVPNVLNDHHYPVGHHRDLFCRRTDACRNIGFVYAAQLNPTHVLTLDDDVHPIGAGTFQGTGGDERRSKFFETNDPIQAHLDVLNKRVPLGWMNTAQGDDPYLRGFPYEIRDEAPVMLSHGVWVGTPDFDGETQLRLERCGYCTDSPFDTPQGWVCPHCKGSGKTTLPPTLQYYEGPIPRGVRFPLCGMAVMVRADALPYLYFAPMGPDTGVRGLNRFADIYMGLWVQKVFAEKGWACYTGGSTIHHTRASDARINFDQEKLGREWLEHLWRIEDGDLFGTAPIELLRYYKSWCEKRTRYAALISGLLSSKNVVEK